MTEEQIDELMSKMDSGEATEEEKLALLKEISAFYDDMKKYLEAVKVEVLTKRLTA